MTAPYLSQPVLDWQALFAEGESDLLITYGEWASLGDEERKAHPVTQLKQKASEAWLRDRAQKLVDAHNLEPQPFVVSSREEIMNRPSPRWLVADLIQENTICLLAAPGGLGKTFLAISISNALATGAPFFGKRTQKGKTLYVIAEGTAAFGDRLRAWESDHPSLMVPADAIAYVEQGVNLKDPQSVETLANMVREGDYSLVILDTLSQLAYLDNENSNAEVAQTFNAIKRIRAAREGTSILVLDHTPAGGGKARGATAKRDNSDTVVMAIPVGEKGEEGFSLSTRDEHGGKQKDGQRIEWHGFSLQPILNSAVVSNNGGKRPLSPFWEKCLPLLQEGTQSSTALREACGIDGDMRTGPGKRFKRELDHWEKDGLVVKSGTKTRPVYELSDAYKGVTQ